MKAFSSMILSEAVDNSIVQTEAAHKLIAQDENTIMSLLECEEMGLIEEMNARRDWYLDLLENADLEVYNEAFGPKILAAIIAAAIAAIAAIIAMLMGKGKGDSGSSGGGSSSSSSSSSSTSDSSSSSSSSSSSGGHTSSASSTPKSEPKSEPKSAPRSEPRHVPKSPKTAKEPPKRTSTYRGYKTHGRFSDADYIDTHKNISQSERSYPKPITGSWNPILTGHPHFEKNCRIDGRKVSAEEYARGFREICQHITVTVTKYRLPNDDVITGDLKTTDDLIKLTKDFESAVATCVRMPSMIQDELNNSQKQEIESKMQTIRDQVDGISSNIESIVATTTEESWDTTAVDYLSEMPSYCTGKVKDMDIGHGIGKVYNLDVNHMTASNKLVELRRALQDLMHEIDKLPENGEHSSSEYTPKLVELCKSVRGLIYSLCGKIKTAYNSYREAVKSDILQMDTICGYVNMVMNHSWIDPDTTKYKFNYDRNYMHFNTPLDIYRKVTGKDPFKHNNESVSIDDDSFIYEDASLDMDDLYQEMADTVSMYNIRCTQYEIRAMNEEAMIFISEASDAEKFEKLQAVNEAIGAKIKKVFYNTIAKIKEIFAKFMEKLRGNFTTTKNYLDRYKEIILRKPFSNDVYGTKNLKFGIDNIEDTGVARLDLTSMTTQLDTLEGAFSVCFKNEHPSNAFDITTADGQAKYWKTVFGMEGEEKRITGKDFQKNIKDYWDFLYDIRNIERSINKSIKDVEDTCNTVMKQAGADVEKPEPQPQNASTVYSYLYNKTFVLENGVLTELNKYGDTAPNASQPAQSGENPAAGDNAQKSYSQRMSNVDKDGDDPDNVGVAKKSGRPIMDTRCNNYTICATTMLKAKMSACEFIRSECMGIIRNEVQKYIGGGTNQTPEQQPQQQQNTAKKAR